MLDRIIIFFSVCYCRDYDYCGILFVISSIKEVMFSSASVRLSANRMMHKLLYRYSQNWKERGTWHVGDRRNIRYWITLGTRQNTERGGSPLVSFDQVIDPHFVTFSSSLYTTISNSNPNPNANPNPNPNHIPNPNPNRNPTTVITDPQIGPRDPQIVTIQICPADPLRSAFCRPIFSMCVCCTSSTILHNK